MSKQIMTEHKFADPEIGQILLINPVYIEIMLKRDIDSILLRKQDVIALAQEFGLKVEDGEH